MSATDLQFAHRQVFKKYSDNEIISEYPGAAAEKEFRKMVFNPEALATAMTGGALHYQREMSLHTAPTIEELKDRKCCRESFQVPQAMFHLHYRRRSVFSEKLFPSEKYLELRYTHICLLEYLNRPFNGVA